MNAAKYTVDLISSARDLKPGQHIVLNYGVMHGRDLAVVVGHHVGQFGHHAECIVVSRNADGEPKHTRHTVEGSPSGGDRIGWKLAYRYTVKVSYLQNGTPREGFWTMVGESEADATWDARCAFEQAGHVVTGTEITAVTP